MPSSVNVPISDLSIRTNGLTCALTTGETVRLTAKQDLVLLAEETFALGAKKDISLDPVGRVAPPVGTLENKIDGLIAALTEASAKATANAKKARANATDTPSLLPQ
jgi:hypothetical protein